MAIGDKMHLKVQMELRDTYSFDHLLGIPPDYADCLLQRNEPGDREKAAVRRMRVAPRQS